MSKIRWLKQDKIKKNFWKKNYDLTLKNSEDKFEKFLLEINDDIIDLSLSSIEHYRLDNPISNLFKFEYDDLSGFYSVEPNTNFKPIINGKNKTQIAKRKINKLKHLDLDIKSIINQYIKELNKEYENALERIESLFKDMEYESYSQKFFGKKSKLVKSENLQILKNNMKIIRNELVNLIIVHKTIKEMYEIYSTPNMYMNFFEY